MEDTAEVYDALVAMADSLEPVAGRDDLRYVDADAIRTVLEPLLSTGKLGSWSPFDEALEVGDGGAAPMQTLLEAFGVDAMGHRLSFGKEHPNEMGKIAVIDVSGDQRVVGEPRAIVEPEPWPVSPEFGGTLMGSVSDEVIVL
mgnify:CR=1 FL=1